MADQTVVRDVGARRVAVLGLGFVGSTVAARASDMGFDVIGFDTDAHRVAGLREGDRSEEGAVDGRRRHGRLRWSSLPGDVAHFDVAVIAVPTPTVDGTPVTTHLEAAAALVGHHLRRGATVVVESSSFPGTTEEVVAPVLERCSGLMAGPDFHLGYSPERIDAGNRAWDLKTTPKVVSGVDARSLEAVRSFYDRLVDTTVPVEGIREAELAKLLENTFRQVNIALVNEVAVLAHQTGIDVRRVLDAAGTKPFGFMAFEPGPGVGGHCLTDVALQLSWWSRQRTGTASRMVQSAVAVNEGMPGYVVERFGAGLRRRGVDVAGSHLLVVGAAYKPNVGDLRRSPAVAVIDLLLAMGAEVRVHDRYVRPDQLDRRVELVELDAEQLAGADGVLVLTDHDDVDYRLVADSAGYVFDARHRLQPSGSVERL